MTSAWDWLRGLAWCPMSVERQGPATNSERRRWLQNKAVVVNGSALGPDDPMPPVESLVFFPKGRRRTTML